jgi:hypothetical protein
MVWGAIYVAVEPKGFFITLPRSCRTQNNKLYMPSVYNTEPWNTHCLHSSTCHFFPSSSIVQFLSAGMTVQQLVPRWITTLPIVSRFFGTTVEDVPSTTPAEIPG